MKPSYPSFALKPLHTNLLSTVTRTGKLWLFSCRAVGDIPGDNTNR